MGVIHHPPAMTEDIDRWLSHPISHYRHNDDPRSEYFQVERDVEDDIFLQQFFNNELKHINYHHYNVTVKKFNKVVENQVVWKLLENSRLWESLHELAKQSNQYHFFDSAIRASATLVYLLYPKDYLYKCGRIRSIFNQLNVLWEHFARVGKQKRPIDDVFKALFRDKILKDKFCYVTEYWLAQLSTTYETGLTIPPVFENPAMSYHRIQRKTPTFDHIKKIVTQMDYPPTFKVDDYTRMLIKFARRDGIKYEEILLTSVVELVDTEALHNHYPDSCPEDDYESESPLKELDVKLMYFFEYLIHDLKRDVKEWIQRALGPLIALLRPINAVDEPVKYLFISANVYELIEVAELRRTAVGSRFISRNHLMWAFYECGYGLPPKLRKSINLNTDDDDEDHPPYHVYMTSIKLAESFEEKKLQLEHFVFVILYMKDVDIDDEMQVIKMQNCFKDFLKDLNSMERPKGPRSQCESKEHSCFESCGLKYPIGVEDLKKTLKSGKLESLVRCGDSLIA